jgi:hypothetical protein
MNSLSPAKNNPLTPQVQELINNNSNKISGFAKPAIVGKNDWGTKILDNGFERGRKSQNPRLNPSFVLSNIMKSNESI